MNKHLFHVVVMIFLAAGCSSSPGPDAISSHVKQTGAEISNCTEKCHNGSNTMSPDPLSTNGTGTFGKHIAHVQNSGIPCQKCHFGYMTKPTHMNGRLDTGDPGTVLVFFDATNPTGTWINDTGPSTGSCTSLNCHGTDTIGWYETGSANFHDCGTCHSKSIGSRRPVTGANGDFGANAGIVSHHVTSAGDPVRAQCLVCHDLSNHTAGTVRLRNADTGAVIAYDPAAPSILEPFCLSCHDSGGAGLTFISGGTPTSPFRDGSELGGPPPNRYQAGNKIAGFWTSSANIHKTNGGLTCLGTGAARTGCHGSSGKINAHGSAVNGLLTNKMNFLISLGSYSTSINPFAYDDYKLCFDCHDNYPSVTKEVILGYKAGGHYDVAKAPTPYYTLSIQSLFRDRYLASPPYPDYWGSTVPLYNDSMWGDPYLPLHNYHLFNNEKSVADGVLLMSWKYRGDASKVGRVTCTTCHNVHGTNGAVRSTYEEFGIISNSPFTPLGQDQYKTFSSPNNFDDDVMTAYPINCNKSCHQMKGQSSYWHSPSDE